MTGRNAVQRLFEIRRKFDHCEQALLNYPLRIYEQSVEGEARFVYYGETNAGRLLAIILSERAGKIRVVTAYELDAGQKRDYLDRRMKGEKRDA